jgi:hypothetical protein
MRAEQILEYVETTPFQPFRIVLNSGQSYEVRHPEMIRLGRRFALLFPDAKIIDRWHTVSLTFVEHLEHIEPDDKQKKRRRPRAS